MYFKQHEGEARVWQLERENWVPFIYRDSRSLTQQLDEVGMGYGYAGCRICKTQEDRTVEFYNSRDGPLGRRTVMEYGVRAPCQDSLDQPDLNNAVSTIMVRGTPGGKVLYWLREVRVLTLAEVFENAQNDASWWSLYNEWVEGECVFGSHPKRGTTTGRATRRSWSGGADHRGRRQKQGGRGGPGVRGTMQ